jgi:hypothetical protein
MCSRYADLADNGGGSAGRYAFGSTFTASALPVVEGLAQGPEDTDSAEAEKYVAYLTSGILDTTNNQGGCGSCWAFAIAQSLQYATELAYRRLHRLFLPRFMSVQYLLSCYQVEGSMCGCMGGDLALALKGVASEGTVLGESFRYDNNADAKLSPVEGDKLCTQNAGRYRGTCPPCKKGEQPKESAGGAVVSCIPCGEAPLPRFYPDAPFRICGNKDPPELRVRLVKQELRRVGPLCCGIGVSPTDIDTLTKRSGQLVEDVTTAPVYRSVPATPSAFLHAVLLVGYYDPFVGSKKPEDRARAVWICRNSWGDDWGYRVKSVSLAESGEARPVTLGGFFNVAIYEGSDIFYTSVSSFRQVLVRGEGDAAPRPLRATDAHTVPLPDLAAVGLPLARGPLLTTAVVVPPSPEQPKLAPAAEPPAPAPALVENGVVVVSVGGISKKLTAIHLLGAALLLLLLLLLWLW